MSFRSRMSARASADLDDILAWLSESSTEAAQRFSDLFEAALDRVEARPYTCGLAFENDAFDEEVRHLLFGPRKKRRYRALFVIRGDEVVILRLGGPGQPPIGPGDVDAD